MKRQQIKIVEGLSSKQISIDKKDSIHIELFEPRYYYGTHYVEVSKGKIIGEIKIKKLFKTKIKTKCVGYLPAHTVLKFEGIDYSVYQRSMLIKGVIYISDNESYCGTMYRIEFKEDRKPEFSERYSFS